MSREIPLSRGMVAIVDDEDYERISLWPWHVHANGGRLYARCSTSRGGQRVRFYMHQLVLGEPADLLPDHIDRDGLNNRKANLRPATPSQNTIYSIRRPSKWGYRGVQLKAGGRSKQPYFAAHVVVNGRRIERGFFKTPEGAARLYDRLAREIYGEFAVLNFP